MLPKLYNSINFSRHECRLPRTTNHPMQSIMWPIYFNWTAIATIGTFACPVTEMKGGSLTGSFEGRKSINIGPMSRGLISFSLENSVAIRAGERDKFLVHDLSHFLHQRVNGSAGHSNYNPMRLEEITAWIPTTRDHCDCVVQWLSEIDFSLNRAIGLYLINDSYVCSFTPVGNV